MHEEVSEGYIYPLKSSRFFGAVRSVAQRRVISASSAATVITDK